MLEAAVLLEIVLGKYFEGATIAFLLAFNAGLGFFQEGRAQSTLLALKSRLALTASVKRDNAWKTVPAIDLVVGDVLKLSLGAVVPADVRLTDGSILLDQSMLTGESVPIEAATGFEAFAGALVRRGEAVAEVTATGAATKFGRTAKLVQMAKVESTQQKAVFRVVRNLAFFDAGVIVLLVIYAYFLKMPAGEIVPLVLTAVLGSIPVGLPATFTLAAALGARALAKLDVLPTRLSAVDEAASIDVLCVDKTGTLTLNQLAVTTVHALAGFDEAHVLGLAALASSDGGQDPVDAAVRNAALKKTAPDLPKLIKFIPFDPATKMSESTATDASGATVRVSKGAFSVISKLAQSSQDAAKLADGLEAQGFRVLAVAIGPSSALKMAGLIALSDPPRPDSAALIKELRTLGVRAIMLTGDAAETAASVARAAGMDGKAAPTGAIPADVRPEQFSIFAGILPEGKYNLVKAFQKSGHTVGMCGDGANDGPALRQAQMGIAVSTATDVAKSAAGIVLTEPGLGGIVASVKEGRAIFQRILTYTLNSISNKITKIFFLTAGLVMTGHAILTPLLMIISMLSGDLPGMSLTTDNVKPSARANSWQIGKLTVAGVFMGIAELLFCTASLAVGKFALGYDINKLRTLAFIALVFGNQAATYLNRDRGRLGSCPPSRWLIASSVIDICIGSALAVCGIAMARIPVLLVGELLVAAAGFAFVVDFVKVPVYARLKIS
jgi:H+-transporting ATPase